MYGKNQIASQTLFYPYNTELVADTTLDAPLQQLVIQASGLQFVEYLLAHGYDENTVVRFVDYNLFALECMEHIVLNWNGTNYLEFVNQYVESRSKFLKNRTQDWITLTGQQQDVDFVKWCDILYKVKFEFAHQDLVLNKGLEVKEWLDDVPSTIVHLSHIFNYDPNSPFVPLRHRVYNENMLLDKIKKFSPDATVVIVDKASDVYTGTLPTWHMDGEWQ